MRASALPGVTIANKCLLPVMLIPPNRLPGEFSEKPKNSGLAENFQIFFRVL